MNELTIYFIMVGLIVAMILSFLKKRIKRKVACFQMYHVRDDLVLLVAENKIKENSLVFQYFYKRINNLLEKTPNIGIEDIAKSMLYSKNTNIEQAIKKAEKEIIELNNHQDMDLAEVRTIIERYYSASKNMIYSHSSVVRFFYLILLRGDLLSTYLAKILKKIHPQQICKAISMIKFTDKEISILKNHAIS